MAYHDGGVRRARVKQHRSGMTRKQRKRIAAARHIAIAARACVATYIAYVNNKRQARRVQQALRDRYGSARVRHENLFSRAARVSYHGA